MRTHKFRPAFALLAGILFTAGFCRAQLPEAENPALLAQPDAMLAGIERIYVVIAAAEPNDSGGAWTELEKKVEQQLKEAGVRVLEARYLGRRVMPTGANISELRIEIGTLKLDDAQQCIFYVRTSLARTLQLPKKPRLSVTADVWKTRPVMQVASGQDVTQAVNDVVSEQAETFIHAYLAANPPDRRTGDNNDVNTAIAPAGHQPSTEPGRQQAAEGRFVASKNSKVFHIPDCRAIERILPENLETYSTRNEAIKAGKRPCRLCRP